MSAWSRSTCHRYLMSKPSDLMNGASKDPVRFDHVTSAVAGKRLTYKGLTGEPTPA